MLYFYARVVDIAIGLFVVMVRPPAASNQPYSTISVTPMTVKPRHI